MTASAAPAVTDRAAARARLYAEQLDIGRRHAADLDRLDQIRAELAELADEPRD